jgi:hypothetical protein
VGESGAVGIKARKVLREPARRTPQRFLDMYLTVRTKDFDKSIATLRRVGLSDKLEKKLDAAVLLLAAGKRLPASYRDHQLHGDAYLFE